ncbi:MAG: GNAT family N-acetyltransferase [Comamonadaceae bacterium]|nr:GNAT family N-acetyltransferase [Comamonadaceae bacterium]
MNGTSGRILHVGGSSLTLRDIAPSDRRAVLDLHTLVFGPDVDERWFTWKYGQAPNQGQGQAVGVWCGGDLIAYCGGLPRTLWTNNSGLRALQIGDVMVHPAWRGILTRRGPFTMFPKVSTTAGSVPRRFIAFDWAMAFPANGTYGSQSYSACCAMPAQLNPCTGRHHQCQHSICLGIGTGKLCSLRTRVSIVTLTRPGCPCGNTPEV